MGILHRNNRHRTAYSYLFSVKELSAQNGGSQRAFWLVSDSWGKEFRAFLTPRQIQYGGFERAILRKSGDMIRGEVRIICLLFLWHIHIFMFTDRKNNRFQKELIMQNTNIWIWAPPHKLGTLRSTTRPQLRRAFNTKQSFKQSKLKQKEWIICGYRGFLSSVALCNTTWNWVLSGLLYDVTACCDSLIATFSISTLRKISRGFGPNTS